MKYSLLLVLLVLVLVPSAFCWSKEGHMMTCKIAQDLLEPYAEEAVRNLLPERRRGSVIAMCVGRSDKALVQVQVDQLPALHRHPRQSVFLRVHKGLPRSNWEERHVCGGAISNFTSQLLHYKHGTSDRRYNLTEALLFLSHFMGDVHQPMHVGFTSDEGGNTIQLRWYRHKSNLHHVWDREIILTALKQHYGNDVDAFQKDLQNNYTAGAWSDDVSTWGDCDDLLSCPTRYATESINLACKWGYDGVTDGDTLSEKYFEPRFPIVAKRIAQGGVRLAMYLNHIFGENNRDIVAAT